MIDSQFSWSRDRFFGIVKKTESRHEPHLIFVDGGLPDSAASDSFLRNLWPACVTTMIAHSPTAITKIQEKSYAKMLPALNIQTLSAFQWYYRKKNIGSLL